MGMHIPVLPDIYYLLLFSLDSFGVKLPSNLYSLPDRPL